VLPRRLQIEFSRVVQEAADATGKELASAEIWRLFEAEYLSASGPWVYRSHQLVTSSDDSERITLHVERHGAPLTIHGNGTGPIDAIVHALNLPIDVVAYDEHSCGAGSEATAVAYVEVQVAGARELFGAGRHANIITASLLAVFSAVNRAIRLGLLDAAQSATRTGT
jgi:2-isopropylmalate synthase